jgi:hypothetical protein
LYTPLESIDDQIPSVTSVDHFHQSSSEPGVIHDVVDEEEIFIERFSYGNYFMKIEAARASLSQLSFPQGRIPVSKRKDPQTVNRSIIDLFEKGNPTSHYEDQFDSWI